MKADFGTIFYTPDAHDLQRTGTVQVQKASGYGGTYYRVILWRRPCVAEVVVKALSRAAAEAAAKALRK